MVAYKWKSNFKKSYWSYDYKYVIKAVQHGYCNSISSFN